MTIEEKLKDLILSRYKSIREFTISADIPYTTMDSIFRRGVDNCSVSTIVKVCKALRISVDDLANGKIVHRAVTTTIDSTDMKDIVADAKYKLSHANEVTIDGKKINIEIVEPFIEALDIGFEMAKKKSTKAESITETITEY